MENSTQSKIIFYSVCLSLLGGVGFLFYLMTSAPSSPKNPLSATNETPRNEKTEDSHLSQELREERTLESSSQKATEETGWGNLFGGDATPEAQLQESATRENTIANLRQLFMSGQDEEFEERIQALMRDYPGTVDYPALAADFYFSQRDFPKTEEALRAVLDLDPENAVARTSLAEVLLVQGKTEHALEEFENVFHENPRFFDGVNGMLQAYQKAGKYEEGVQKVKKAFDADPSNPAAARVYATTLAREGKIDERDRVILSAVEANPYDAHLLNSASEVALRKGDKQQALELSEQAFQYAKSRRAKSDALNLIWASAMENKNFAAAERVIQRQKELRYDPETILLNERLLQEARTN